jgi:hypothetical protein
MKQPKSTNRMMRELLEPEAREPHNDEPEDRFWMVVTIVVAAVFVLLTWMIRGLN